MEQVGARAVVDEPNRLDDNFDPSEDYLAKMKRRVPLCNPCIDMLSAIRKFLKKDTEMTYYNEKVRKSMTEEEQLKAD